MSGDQLTNQCVGATREGGGPPLPTTFFTFLLPQCPPTLLSPHLALHIPYEQLTLCIFYLPHTLTYLTYVLTISYIIYPFPSCFMLPLTNFLPPSFSSYSPLLSSSVYSFSSFLRGRWEVKTPPHQPQGSGRMVFNIPDQPQGKGRMGFNLPTTSGEGKCGVQPPLQPQGRGRMGFNLPYQPQGKRRMGFNLPDQPQGSERMRFNLLQPHL